MSAPGTDVGASDREQLPVDTARRVADETGRADSDADDEIRPDDAGRRLPCPAKERGNTKRPEDETDDPAEGTDDGACDHRCLDIRLGRRLRRGAAAGAEEVDAEEQERGADDDLKRGRGKRPRDGAADDGADRRRREHPESEPPVDAARADVRDRSGRGGKPGNGDIRAGRGSRVPCRGEEDREADVPQHEPEQAPDERHE